ncbi:MAG TPA: glycosyltransferase [Verrucomicrobiae bacterium]|nr:glycosyltransferase [Verrucomicrobiae bacterium]
MSFGDAILLGVCAIPFIFYGITLFSCWRFFRRPLQPPEKPGFTPPVSNLKPIRGLDPDAYENFASFCRQDYPDYELVFCVSDREDAVLPVIEQLQRDFPDRRIRVLFGAGRDATNDKVAKLARLVSEAAHEHVVISDSDVRVQPDYLRSVMAPLADPKVGAVTCFYASTDEHTFVDRLQSVGMMSDFYAGIIVAWQLDGVKFALGPTIATTRARLAAFGGYESIENRPADDLLVGRLIADQGYEVELLRYPIQTVADYQSIRELMHKRLRWIVVMRHMRPWGHFGLIFTHGLIWSLLAVAIHPTAATALGFLGGYFAVRCLVTWMIQTWGLKLGPGWRKMWMIPVWDLLAFLIWLASFTRSTVRWRGADYYIREGLLVPVVEK